MAIFMQFSHVQRVAEHNIYIIYLYMTYSRGTYSTHKNSDMEFALAHKRELQLGSFFLYKCK